jgi:catechol 2,3-dioxygenase-like lactoylglutathione lyase family enzyme
LSDVSLKPKRMRIVIRSYDLDRSLEFYRDQLGLSVIESWNRPDGAGHLIDAAGGVIELLGKTPGDASRGGWDFVMPVAKYEILLEVSDARAAHAALKAKEVETLSEPEATSWGGVHFTVTDPDETPVVYLSK